MKRSMLVALMATLFLTTAAFGQSEKLQAFTDAVKEAQKGPSCLTIPYEGLRDNCKDQGKEVHPWCDGKNGPIKCESGVTADLIKSLVREHRTLDGLDEKRREIDNKRDHAADQNEKNKFQANLEVTDKEIESSKRRIEDLNKEVSNRKDLVEKTRENIDKCIRYRTAVMNIFGEVRSKVDSESEPDIKPLAADLLKAYNETTKDHEDQIEGKKNAEENCRKELP